MKRKWIAGFFLCLILILVFFQYGGRWVRDLLSPEVICIYPKMELLDEYEFHTFLMFPEECVQTENDGILYIWTVSRTDEYPEEAFKANKRVIQITQETDDMVYVSFQFIPSGEAIVRNWTGQIADGGRVVVENDSKKP